MILKFCLVLLPPTTWHSIGNQNGGASVWCFSHVCVVIMCCWKTESVEKVQRYWRN